MSELGAFGQLSGLFYLNIPKCVKHKEDHPIPIRRPGGSVSFVGYRSPVIGDCGVPRRRDISP
jgi:hypothetical protein